MKEIATKAIRAKVSAKSKSPIEPPAATVALPMPSPWPNANARLLGLGVGLPVTPLDRLAQFDDKAFERFVLEWAHEYLAGQVPDVVEVQQRGGSGDKGRDVIAWLDPSNVTPRRWRLYQCKHYAARLSSDAAAREIGKVLYYTHQNDYTAPEEYHFVTHRGVANPLQDLLDDPEKLRAFVIDSWMKNCATTITGTKTVDLSGALLAHAQAFDFSIFRAKQPIDLLNEHRQTRYHLAVFGAPLIDRAPPPAPPSTMAAEESGYLGQLFDVIAEHLNISVSSIADFAHADGMRALFERSRIMFYSAEGLKELARDHMADAAYFETLLTAFSDGLYHAYTDTTKSGLERLRHTVLAAQSLQLGGHVLEPHATPSDREGACHHLANEDRLRWCER
jgi:hypothetical protein